MSVVDHQFGTDANDGSYEHPFATIAHAVTVNKPQEIIFVLPDPEDPSELVTGRKTRWPIWRMECLDPKQPMNLMRE